MDTVTPCSLSLPALPGGRDFNLLLKDRIKLSMETEKRCTVLKMGNYVEGRPHVYQYMSYIIWGNDKANAFSGGSLPTTSEGRRSHAFPHFNTTIQNVEGHLSRSFGQIQLTVPLTFPGVWSAWWARWPCWCRPRSSPSCSPWTDSCRSCWAVRRPRSPSSASSGDSDPTQTWSAPQTVRTGCSRSPPARSPPASRSSTDRSLENKNKFEWSPLSYHGFDLTDHVVSIIHIKILLVNVSEYLLQTFEHIAYVMQ